MQIRINPSFPQAETMLNLGRDDGWGVNATGAAPTGADRSTRAPAKVPHSRTSPLLIREATVATTSASLVAHSLTAWTRSSSVAVLGVAMVGSSFLFCLRAGSLVIPRIAGLLPDKTPSRAKSDHPLCEAGRARYD